MTYDCGAIYAKEKCQCGHSPVLWTHLETLTMKRTNYWKCGCGKEYPRKEFKVRRGRRRKT